MKTLAKETLSKRVRRLLPHITLGHYTKERGNSSCMNGHFSEYRHSAYVSWFKRTCTFSWVWSIDTYGRRGYTPFNTRMNYTAWLFKLGYIHIHMTKKY